MPEADVNEEAALKLIITELDPSLYAPSREEVDFLKSQTKIEDENELKRHVLTVQKAAWECQLVKYRRIQVFSFLMLRISNLPPYQDLLKRGRERQGAIFLDIDCTSILMLAIGNDIRKSVSDDYPARNIVAMDLEGPFWDLEHKLFKSTPESFPVRFIQGDVFDPRHLTPGETFYAPPTTPRPVLSILASPRSRPSMITYPHTSLVFHLFNKEEHTILAHLIAPLLSPIPGSVDFGVHSPFRKSCAVRLVQSVFTALARRTGVRCGTVWCLRRANKKQAVT